MRKLLLISAFLCLISSIAFASPKGGPIVQKIPPTLVTLENAKNQIWQDNIHVTGTLNASQSVNMTAEIAGRVVKICFNSGQYVRKGDELVELYSDITAAELRKAKSQHELDKLNYARYSELYKKRFVDLADLDKSRATMEGSRADVDELQAKYEQTIVKAPFDGKLGLRQINVGDYVAPGQAIVGLHSTKLLRADFSVPEQYIPSISIGQPVYVKSVVTGERLFEGSIYALDSAINQNTRTLAVRATIPNQNGDLVPGGFVEVTIPIGSKNPVIMIPQTAILYSTAGNYVYRSIDHKAVKTNIVIGNQLPDNKIIVKTGLTESDLIITEGQMKVHDGSPVMTQEEAVKMFATASKK